MSYQSYLQNLAAGGGLQGQEAQALLNAGMYNQGGVVKNNVANVITNGIGGLTGNYGLAGFLGYNDRGHIQSGNQYYGAQGLNALHNKYSSQYTPPQTLGAYSGAAQYSGSGGGGYAAPSGPSYDPNQVALYDQAIKQIHNQQGRLGTQRNIAYGNIDSQFNTNRNELQSAFNRAQGQYNDSTTQNSQAQRTNFNNINDKASTGARGLARLYLLHIKNKTPRHLSLEF